MGNYKTVLNKSGKTNISKRKVGEQQIDPSKVDRLMLKFAGHEDLSSLLSFLSSKKKKSQKLATIYELFGCYYH